MNRKPGSRHELHSLCRRIANSWRGHELCLGVAWFVRAGSAASARIVSLALARELLPLLQGQGGRNWVYSVAL